MSELREMALLCTDRGIFREKCWHLFSGDDKTGVARHILRLIPIASVFHVSRIFPGLT